MPPIVAVIVIIVVGNVSGNVTGCVGDYDCVCGLVCGRVCGCNYDCECVFCLDPIESQFARRPHCNDVHGLSHSVCGEG